MDGINVLAVIVAALAAFFLGGFWYSKSVFGKIWSDNAGTTKKTNKHGSTVFVIAFICYLLSAFVFAVLIGPQPELWYAVKTGAEIGVFFVATSFGINYSFGGRGYKLFLIDACYHTLQFITYGVVLGLWH